MHTLRGTDTPQGGPHCLRAQAWRGVLGQQDPRCGILGHLISPSQALPLDAGEVGAGAGGGTGTSQRSNPSPLLEKKMVSADVDQPPSTPVIPVEGRCGLDYIPQGHSQTSQETSSGPSLSVPAHTQIPHQGLLKVSLVDHDSAYLLWTKGDEQS